MTRKKASEPAVSPAAVYAHKHFAPRASAGMVAVSRRGIFFRPGGRIGSQIGRLYRFGGPRRAELAASRTPVGRFGFYICLGFRAL